MPPNCTPNDATSGSSGAISSVGDIKFNMGMKANGNGAGTSPPPTPPTWGCSFTNVSLPFTGDLQ